MKLVMLVTVVSALFALTAHAQASTWLPQEKQAASMQRLNQEENLDLGFRTLPLKGWSTVEVRTTLGPRRFVRDPIQSPLEGLYDKLGTFSLSIDFPL